MTLTFVYMSFKVNIRHWIFRKPLGVRDRGLVQKDHQQEMAYGELNGHVIDNVTWPERSNSWPWPQYDEPNISKTAVDTIYQQSLITK